MGKKDYSINERINCSDNLNPNTCKPKFTLGYNNQIWQNEPAPWHEIMKALLPYKGNRHSILIPVSPDSFETLELTDQLPFDPERIRVYMQICTDRSAYQNEVPKLIEGKIVRADATFIDFGLIKAMICIEEGYRGDSDGFGVEPDTWIEAYLNLQGEFVSPFSLTDSPSKINIRNLMIFGINPVNGNGTIRECPFNEVEKCYHLPDYFMVRKESDYGLADKNMNVVIPPVYRMISDESNGLIWVRLHNNLCGIIDLENQFIIPPIYSYLSFSRTYKGIEYYKAELNGEKMTLKIKKGIDYPDEKTITQNDLQNE